MFLVGEFDIIGWYDETTAINVPWIVDWYWNFGDIGVIVGMLCSGLLLGLIDRLYNGVDIEPFDLAVWPVSDMAPLGYSRVELGNVFWRFAAYDTLLYCSQEALSKGSR